MNGPCELVRTCQRPSSPLPGDRAVRLEMHVLHARGRVGLLVDDVGLLEALRDVADLALQGAEDVAVVGRRVLVVQDRRAGLHGGYRIEHRRQDLVLDLERAARRLRPPPRSRPTTAASRWPTKRATLSSM